MTAYVVFSAIRSGQMTIETPIAMSVHAAQEPPSKMYFKPGERFPLDSALKYLMVKSANDVAVAIAEAVSGSEEAFVRDMNAAALRIGMTSTRFVNPNGPSRKWAIHHRPRHGPAGGHHASRVSRVCALLRL